MQQCVNVCTWAHVCVHIQHKSKHTQRHAYTEQQRWGGVKSVYMFVSLSAFSSMAPLIGGRAAWSDDAMRQRQPMWCAILLSRRPSLIPASRPCLYVTAVMPAVSHSTGAVCYVCVSVHVCKSLCAHVCCCLDKSIQTPASLPPLAVMVEVKGEGGGPFERLPSFSSIQPPSAHCSTAQLTSSLRQTEWIKGDTMRHLM